MIERIVVARHRAVRDLFPMSVIRRAILLFVLWTVFGLLSSAHFFFGYEGATDAASFLVLADNVIVFYWGWALLTPLVIVIARRVARSQQDWREWAMLVLAGIALVFVHGILHEALTLLFGIAHKDHPAGGFLIDYARRHGGGDLATFAVLVGGTFFIETSRGARAREIAASELESRLARANLELLRWHLHPHFLFNALNTVSTLVLKGENQRADEAITLISRYLRAGLTQQAHATVSLSDELIMVGRYVEIEKLRFGDSLRLEMAIDDAALQASVPGLVMQPLVENAIMHGIARQDGATPIRIGASVVGERLRLTVSNPRNGLPADSAESTEDSARFGLRYVRERLHQFYGDDATFELSLQSPDTVAALDIPFSRA